MNKIYKEEKGITLLTLTITIIIMIILASIITYSGVSSIESSKLTKFRQELEILQAQVDVWHAKYFDDQGQKIKEIDIGEELTDKAKETLIEVSESENEQQEKYKLFTEQTLESLGIQGIERTYIINIEDRNIVSLEAFVANGQEYYTLADVTGGQIKTKNNKDIKQGEISFDLNLLTGKIIQVEKVKLSKNAGTGRIQYRIKNKGKAWQTAKEYIKSENNIKDEEKTKYQISLLKSENDKVIPGTYEIKITDSVGNYTINTIEITDHDDDIIFTPNPGTWTNKDVNVKVVYGKTLKDFKLKVADGVEQSVENSATVTAKNNGLTIWAKATDMNGKDVTATYIVNNIDRDLPEINLAASPSTENAEITLTADVKDAASGISKIIWYYKKTTDASYESITSTYATLNGSETGKNEITGTKTIQNLEAGAAYDIYAAVYDVAGNRKESTSINNVKITTPIEIITGNGKTTGDIISVEIIEGTKEKFYVLSYDEKTGYAKALAMYNLKVGNISENDTITEIDTSVEGYGLQDPEMKGMVTTSKTYKGTVEFSSRAYWSGTKYNIIGERYPYVYDESEEKCTINQYVKSYKEKLGNTNKIKEVKLASHGDINNLWSQKTTYTWLRSTSYWLGSSENTTSNVIWNVNSNGTLKAVAYFSNKECYGVRPVITIDMSQI